MAYPAKMAFGFVGSDLHTHWMCYGLCMPIRESGCSDRHGAHAWRAWLNLEARVPYKEGVRCAGQVHICAPRALSGP